MLFLQHNHVYLNKGMYNIFAVITPDGVEHKKKLKRAGADNLLIGLIILVCP
jgi:hypothetical protein